MAQPTAPFTRRQQLVGDKPHWIDASQHFFTYDDPVRTAPNKCRWGKFKTIVGITTPEANGSLSLDHVPSQTLQIVQKGQTSVDEINQFRYPPPPQPAGKQELAAQVQQCYDAAADANAARNCHSLGREEEETGLQLLRTLAFCKPEAEVERLIAACTRYGEEVTQLVIEMWQSAPKASRHKAVDTSVWPIFRALFVGPHKILKMDKLGCCEKDALTALWRERTTTSKSSTLVTFFALFRKCTAHDNDPGEPVPYNSNLKDLPPAQKKVLVSSLQAIQQSTVASSKSAFIKRFAVGFRFLDDKVEQQYRSLAKSSPVTPRRQSKTPRAKDKSPEESTTSGMDTVLHGGGATSPMSSTY
jgi:hypothetical protein